MGDDFTTPILTIFPILSRSNQHVCLSSSLFHFFTPNWSGSGSVRSHEPSKTSGKQSDCMLAWIRRRFRFENRQRRVRRPRRQEPPFFFHGERSYRGSSCRV